MKTMLILTDFSESAFRAAEYGCELISHLGIKRIVLYHAYQQVMAFAGSPEFVGMSNDSQQTYLESMEALGLLQDRLKPMIQKDVSIELLAEDITLSGLVKEIEKRSAKEKIDIVVMGRSGKSGLDKIFLGSTTTKILREGEWPVLVVPEDTLLGKEINNIVLTSDLKEVDPQSIRPLYEFLDVLPGKLHMVNVEPKEKENYSPEMKKAISDLHNLLEKYNPEFTYINGDDIVEEILRFAGDQHDSLIVAIHQKHGFLSSLVRKSVTNKLAFSSNVPLLALPASK
jgi:nucleotide-binding universal stress UspA family protein